MEFLSISMDVVGSTALKKRLAEFANQNQTSLDEHYRELLRSMLVSMNCFLDLVSKDPVLDIRRLSLIKRIGDEFWYMYDLEGLDANEITAHSNHIAHTLLVFLLDAHFDVMAFLQDVHIREKLSWKCTIDAITHAVDSSKLAEDELDQFLSNLLNQQALKHDDQRQVLSTPDALIDLRNQLGIGVGYLQDGMPIFVSKRDFIGFEIDRFFRIAQHAEQGRVLAGQSFLLLLEIERNPISEMFSFKIAPGRRRKVPELPDFPVEFREFSEDELKGIKGGYSGAYIYNEYLERADYEGFWDVS